MNHRIYYHTSAGPAAIDTDAPHLPPALAGAVVLAVTALPVVRVGDAAPVVRRVVPVVVDSGWGEAE